MIIERLKTRTTSNPLAGVHISSEDATRINDIMGALASVPGDIVEVMRSALARQIVEYDVLGEWTEGEAEKFRLSRQEQSMIAYRATYVGQPVLAVKS